MVSKMMKKNLKVILKFIGVVFCFGLFGYVGYLYSKDNNEDTFKGFTFGILTPLVLGGMGWLISEFNVSIIVRFICFVINLVLWIWIVEIIPSWIGIIILITLIV